MEFSNFSSKLPLSTDVYTDLNGLQQLKHQDDKDLALRKVAKQFESLFLNMLMKNMRAANAVFEEDSMFNSKETEFFRDMYDQQLSLSMAEGKGVGIADALYRQLSRAQGNTEKGPDSIEGEDNAIQSSAKDISAYLNQAAAAGYKLNAAPIGVSPPQANAATTIDNRVNQKQPAPVSDDASRQIDNPDRIAIAETPDDFIQKLLPYAKNAARALGVDHYILIAQSALETGWGKYVLGDGKGASSNNLFNIKTFSSLRESVQHTTLEYENGVVKKESAAFRTYADLAESFNDFVDFIQGNQRYSLASQVAGDSEAFIDELHKAGYATDPAYKDKVLRVYEQVKSVAEDLVLEQKVKPEPQNLNSSIPSVFSSDKTTRDNLPTGLGIKQFLNSGKTGKNL
ncbi:Peptidoglycan hydrolase FlgJ [Thalassocella blandensis]|nr:Peptidoglycan hydrolase FlgJ [Thalassocella blandensis]